MPIGQVYRENRVFNIAIRFPEEQPALDRGPGGRCSWTCRADPRAPPRSRRGEDGRGPGADQPRERQRRIGIELNVAGRDIAASCVRPRAGIRERVTLPAGYYTTWGGQFENQQQAMRRLAVIASGCRVGDFLLLLLTFRSAVAGDARADQPALRRRWAACSPSWRGALPVGARLGRLHRPLRRGRPTETDWCWCPTSPSSGRGRKRLARGAAGMRDEAQAVLMTRQHRNLQPDPDGLRDRGPLGSAAPARGCRDRRPAQLDRAHAVRAAHPLQLGGRVARAEGRGGPPFLSSSATLTTRPYVPLMAGKRGRVHHVRRHRAASNSRGLVAQASCTHDDVEPEIRRSPARGLDAHMRLHAGDDDACHAPLTEALQQVRLAEAVGEALGDDLLPGRG